MLLRAIQTEFIKLRRTLAFWLVFVAPLTTVLLRLIEWSQRGEQYLFPGVNPWERLGQSVIVIWCMLMLPLFIALEAALLAGLEHNDHQWKHLFALPVPRWAILSAKSFVSLIMVGISSIVLWVAILIAGLFLKQINPALGFADHTLPGGQLLLRVILVFLASWLILAIHLWISLRWRSFALAMGVGIACTFIGLILAGSVFGWIYPWSLPVNIVYGTGERVVPAVLLGVIGGIIATTLGNSNIGQRDVL